MSQSIVYIQEKHPNPTETFVRAEVNELYRRSYDVWVTCFEIVKDFLPQCDYADHILSAMWHEKPEKQVLSLTECIHRLKPRYLHTHFATEAFKYTFPVAKQLNLPFGFTCHAYDLWLRGARVEPEMLHMLGNHELCLTVAVEGTKHRDYLLWCGVPKEKIIVTPNSVDSHLLPATKETLPKQIEKIILVGRPVPKKGFLVAIDALRLLRLRGMNMELHIIGGADASQPLGQIVSDYAQVFPFIKTSPLLSHKQTLKYIQQADLLVMPSMVAENGDSDGIPTVLAEAMLLGIPVVACDVGSISDLVIPGETGFFARPGDPASLAEKIAEVDKLLQTTPDQAQTLLERAKSRARQQEVQTSVNTLVRHLEEQIGRAMPSEDLRSG